MIDVVAGQSEELELRFEPEKCLIRHFETRLKQQRDAFSTY